MLSKASIALAGLLACSAFVCAACSLRYDVDPFRTPFPSKAIIELAPAEAKTGNDLVVAFVEESTVSNGEAIEYVFEWWKDGTKQEDLTSDVVTGRRTTRGEIWRVRVTPVTALTRRAGEPTEAEVTILDTAAEIRSVGFSNYQPHRNEIVQAYVVFDDPDGDLPSLQYQWLLNGEPLEGETQRAIGLQAIDGIEPADELGVRVKVSAQSDEAQVLSDSVVIQQDVARWRRRLPDRNEFFVWHVWDPVHQRVLIMPGATETGTLWELAIDNESPQGRFVQLPSVSPSPSTQQVITSPTVYDPTRQRVLLVAPTDTGMEVWSLQLDRRVVPGWELLEVTGESPPMRFVPFTLVDETRDRLLMVGGIDNTRGLSDVWALEFSEDPPVWQPLGDASDEGGGGAVVRVPGESRAFFLGGLEQLAGSMQLPAHNRVVEIDFGQEQPVFSTAGLLPDDLGFGMGVYVPHPSDPLQDRIYVGYGLKTIDQTQDGLWAFRPHDSNPNFETIAVQGEAPSYYSLWSRRVAFFHEGSRRVIFDTADLDLNQTTWERGFWALDPAIGEARPPAWTPLARYGVDLPPSLGLSIVWPGQNSAMIWGGARGQGGFMEDQAWTYDFGQHRFSPTEMKATTPNLPETRGGIFVSSEHTQTFPPTERWIFGGMDRWWTTNLPVPLDSRTWARVGSTWTQLDNLPPAPEARFAHSMFGSLCENWDFGYFGGMNGVGGVLNDVGRVRCADGVCTHQANIVTGGPAPSARGGAAPALNVAMSHVVFFGGIDGEGVPPDSDVWLLEMCDPSPSWTLASITGDPPSPRFGHSMTALGSRGSRGPYLVMGGFSPEPDLRVWRLTHESGTEYKWEELTDALAAAGPVPSNRAGHAAFVDPDRSVVLVYGGARPPGDGGVSCGGSGAECLPAWSDLWELRIPPESE